MKSLNCKPTLPGRTSDECREFNNTDLRLFNIQSVHNQNSTSLSDLYWNLPTKQTKTERKSMGRSLLFPYSM